MKEIDRPVIKIEQEITKKEVFIVKGNCGDGYTTSWSWDVKVFSDKGMAEFHYNKLIAYLEMYSDDDKTDTVFIDELLLDLYDLDPRLKDEDLSQVSYYIDTLELF